MAALDIETFEPQIRPWVRRCPHEVLEQVIRNVLRDFCQFTRAWQYVPAAQTIAIATASYTLLLPGSYAEPITVEWTSVDGGRSYPKDVLWLDQNIPTWRTRSADDFTFFTQLLPTTMIWAALPATAGTTDGWRYRISLKPTMTATQVDDSLFNQWADEIADGAKAKLMSMPGQDWSDLKLAAYHESLYRIKRARARIRVSKSYGDVDLNALPEAKFAGR